MKVTFANPHLEYLGACIWRVCRRYVVTIDGETFVIPKGFETDLDSIPRLPLAYWLVKGRAIRSAIIHDYLYMIQRPRKWCDEVMYAAMETEFGQAKNLWGRMVNASVRYAIYFGVRIGGGKAYGKKGKPIEEVPPP